jgi:hypothetical protein
MKLNILLAYIHFFINHNILVTFNYPILESHSIPKEVLFCLSLAAARLTFMAQKGQKLTSESLGILPDPQIIQANQREKQKHETWYKRGKKGI